MALRSRKVKERTVEVSSSVNAEDKLTVIVRALLETELQWLGERNPEVADATSADGTSNMNWTAWMRDLVRIGLVDIPDPPIDPDTGAPFAIKRTQARVAGEKAQLATNDTLNALAEYMVGIGLEIIGLAALSKEERDAARPTMPSSAAPALTVAENAEET